MTLVEVLIAAILTTLVAGVAFVFLQGVSHSTAREEARNVSLVQQVSALQRMTEELSQAYQLNSPTTVGTTNVVDVNAWLATSAGAQTDRRLVYDCEIASSISGERQCERYEMPATDTTAVASLASDTSAKSSIAVARLVNGTSTSPVFSLTSPRGTGGGRPTYGAVTIKTPSSGERVTYVQSGNYSYSTTLTDSFYMRNLDLAE